jgi:hypothetical protein
MKLWLIPLVALLLFLATACSDSTPEAPIAQPPPATPTSAPAVAAATDTSAIEPTQAAAASTTASEIVAEPTTAAPAKEGVDWLTVEGKTADNLAYLGNPDAPVTLIDYSDFL